MFFQESITRHKKCPNLSSVGRLPFLWWYLTLIGFVSLNNFLFDSISSYLIQLRFYQLWNCLANKINTFFQGDFYPHLKLKSLCNIWGFSHCQHHSMFSISINWNHNCEWFFKDYLSIHIQKLLFSIFVNSYCVAVHNVLFICTWYQRLSFSLRKWAR